MAWRFVCPYDKPSFFRIFRSSRPKVFCKKGVLKNFSKFTGKYLCEKLFLNKVADLMPTALLEKRLSNRCLPVNFTKFLRTPFLIEHLWWLVLYVPIWARSVSYQKRAFLVKFKQVSEAVVHRFSSKYVFLKIWQIPQENTCIGGTSW